MTTKRGRRITSLNCPDCAAIGSMCEIACELALRTFDFEKYAVDAQRVIQGAKVVCVH